MKHNLIPYNAYFKAIGLDFLAACPREELHQFLIGLHGDYIIHSTLYEYHKVLRRPDLVTSRPGAEIVTHLISNEMLAGCGPGCGTARLLLIRPLAWCT